MVKAQPINDACANCITITPGTISGSTTTATSDGASNCPGSAGVGDAWYCYTPASGGTVTVHTCTASFDTILSVHTGCPGTAANEVVCNDDAIAGPCAGSSQSYLTFNATAGTTYRIRVSGFGITGTFTLSLESTPQAPSLFEPGTEHCPPAAPNAGCACNSRGLHIGADKTDPVQLYSGEVYETAVDLRIPGRGMDFSWSRTYRSRVGPNTVQGNGWDFAQNARVAVNGANRDLFDGNTRTDTYLLQPDGTWTRSEFFRVLKQNPDTTYTLTFEDGGVWNFFAITGGVNDGKLSAITDRNSNTTGFSYDGFGRLATIHDTLDTVAHNRDITIAYNADGFVSSVTDWMGRQVQYAYYQNADAGGSFGDLKSVNTPAVIGTPNGNDFPTGKTTTYTYSKGFADARQNHNLLTITDGKGQTFVTNTYASTTNPADINFDHVTRQVWGNPGDIIDLVYVAQTPAAANNFAVLKTIVNDRVGNVTEYFYDGQNRSVMLREYTGRADPDQPTTESINRPTDQLRVDDPAFFETRFAYNLDSLVTQIVHPNGDTTNNIYESALNPAAFPRTRGNLREVHHLPGPLGGDQAQIVELYEYDAGMGGCCGSNFVTRATDGRGNVTLHTYDVKGNRLSTTQAIVSAIDNWEYNGFGQMTAHVLPDNGSAHRRRDQFAYYAAGPQMGYLQTQTVDSTGFALATTYEYDAVGNVIRTIDPRGHDTLYTRNALNQVVREQLREVTTGSGIRYEKLTWYDANNNVVRADVQNRDETGAIQANTHFSTLFEYEILNSPVRMCQEKGSANLTNSQLTCSSFSAGQAVTTEYQYDANRNQTLVRMGEATNGSQPNNTVQTLYDERDLVFRAIRAPADAAKSTTQTDYDGNRNRKAVREGLESSPRVTTNVNDGFNRQTSSTDALGNVSTFHYDAAGNQTSQRVDGQLIDVPGGAGNVRLSEITFIYDAMNRQARSDVAFFDLQTQAPTGDGLSSTITEYTDSSQIKRLTDDNGHATNITYDTANRRSVVADAKNNTTTFAYDANSNVVSTTALERSDLGNPNQTFVTSFVNDNLDRQNLTTDAIGNVTQSAYDSRNNATLKTDALGRQTRYVYDGLSRRVQIIRDMNNNGVFTDPVDIATSQGWDDSSRLTNQTDDSGNTTGYAYDALNRRNSTQFSDGTTNVSSYDVHDNVVSFTDANVSVSTITYDLLNRLSSKAITLGPGVANDTTFESLQYDGVSNRNSAVNNASSVTRRFDSMRHVTRETLNGVITQAAYDGDGNEVSCIYPGGRSVTPTYDALDRRLVVSDAGGTIASYSYVGPRRVERRTYGNGTRSDFTYDGVAPNPTNDFGVRMPVRITHSSGGGATILDDRSFTWDRVSNKTRRKDERLAGPRLTHDYTYDAASRLTHTHVTNAVLSVIRDTDYALDGVGNRTTVTGSPDAGNYACSATLPQPADCEMNQYTTTSFDSRAYDRNGNLASYGGCLSADANDDRALTLADVPAFIAALIGTGPVFCGSDLNRNGLVNGRDIQLFVNNMIGQATPTRQFALRYDYANRMVEHKDTITLQRHTYAYDALGRRIKKIVDVDGVAGGPVETRFFFDGWREIEEQNAAGATQATYVFGNYIDEVLSMRRGGTDSYYHADDLYNVLAVTNAAGVVVERYDYQDFGQPSFFNGAGGSMGGTAIGNPLLFTGRRLDSETGLFYYRTRLLESRAGRFTTRDMIEIWGDANNRGNAFTYVGNDPWSALDPSGMIIYCPGPPDRCGPTTFVPPGTSPCGEGLGFPCTIGALVAPGPGGGNTGGSVRLGSLLPAATRGGGSQQLTGGVPCNIYPFGPGCPCTGVNPPPDCFGGPSGTLALSSSSACSGDSAQLGPWWPPPVPVPTLCKIYPPACSGFEDPTASDPMAITGGCTGDPRWRRHLDCAWHGGQWDGYLCRIHTGGWGFGLF